MTLGDVNWVAVVVAAVISIVLGFLWYSKVLFGKQWQAEHGWSDSDLKKKQKDMGPSYGLMIVGSLVAAYVLALVVRAFSASTTGNGVSIGFWVWLGFVATTQLGKVLWEGKSWKLFSIDTGYSLVSYALMGAVLASL
ncbi:MAG: DUF1761 domain-containing protein [Candidatus Andersenbacteria bacterium]